MIRLDGMPVKGDLEDGDSILWAGLMSGVGDTASQLAVKNCQSSDGRIWRSPRRVNNDPKNSFSRDMAFGFIIYFCKTKDVSMAEKWVQYIKKNNSLFPRNESTDNRWMMTPGLWWLMSHVGISVPWYWKITRSLYKYVLAAEIATAKPGYERHLKGVALLALALTTGKRDKELGHKLWMKDPGNAFFAWLAGANNAAQSMNNHLRELHTLHPGRGTQWCWERTDSEDAWKDSMGWDFHFIDMLLALNIQ